MTSVVFKDENGTTFRPDGFPREESGEQVFMQAVVPVDPASGTPLDIATETTLLALNTAIGTLNTVSAAVQAAVEAMNTKTTAINTGAIAGTVELGATSLAALESVQATIANFPTTQQIVGDVDATGSTVAVGNFPATQPISAADLPLPSGAATEATVLATSAALGAKADAAATTDAGTFSLIAFFKRLLGKLPDLSGGRIPVELPPGGGSLSDTELRASPVPVEDETVGDLLRRVIALLLSPRGYDKSQGRQRVTAAVENLPTLANVTTVGTVTNMGTGRDAGQMLINPANRTSWALNHRARIT